MNRIKNLKIWSYIFGKEWTNWLRIHHIIDWITVILIFAAGGLLTLLVEPSNRFLPSNSTLVNYPIQDDIVPNWALFVIVLAVPLVVIAFAQIWQKRPRRHDYHHAALALVTAFSITNFIVTVLKLSTGRYRPNYQTGQVLADDWDGRSSFPSGHSALSFSSMVFLSLYLAGKLRIFRDHSGSLVLKGIVSLLPLGLSFFVSISRVVDYHHDFSDVEAGALIGSGIAIFSYFLWYHSLFSSKAGVPRQHPIEEPTLPVTNSDAVKKEADAKEIPAASSLPQQQAPLGWLNGSNAAQKVDTASGPQ